MSPLNWKELPQKHSSSSPSSGANTSVVSPSNLWFGISMGLMGIIVGFILTILIR